MKEFRWNDPNLHTGSFWDTDSQEIIPYKEDIRCDKSVLNNPGGFEYRVAIQALCRVVSELIELEEKRNG